MQNMIFYTLDKELNMFVENRKIPTKWSWKYLRYANVLIWVLSLKPFSKGF